MISDYKLKSNDHLTQRLRQDGIKSWYDLSTTIEALPYGRNANRQDLFLVWTEQKGTCSSKHAFLKYMADLNRIPNVELLLGLYKMNALNTPNIGSVLSDKHLNYIPEAHCYLNIDGQRMDYTSAHSDFNKIKDDILLEKTIQPQQVSEFKVNFHQSYLKEWILENAISFSFEEIWKIRELCIHNLSA